jgi:phosphatidylglycerophosphatase A
MKFIKEKKIVDENIKVDIFSVLFSTSLLVGFIPKASGTFGSLFALLFFLIPSFENIIIILPLTIIFFVIGIITSSLMVKRYGDDPSVVVIDEVVGMWVTILVLKLIFNQTISFNSIHILIPFFMFRLFDIIKIFPVSYFDRIKSGFGIMMDDVIAGIYAGISSGIIITIITNYLHI